MGLLKKEISQEFIAYPTTRRTRSSSSGRTSTSAASQGDRRADEMAVFLNTGQVIGMHGPGPPRRSMPTSCRSSAPSSTTSTGGNAYRAELYFVGTREYTGNTFGGRIDDVQDPQTGMIVTLRVFGDYSLQGHGPVALILNLTGTVDVDRQRRHHPVGRRPAAQGDAHRGHPPDRAQRLAHPRAVRLHARHRAGRDPAPATAQLDVRAAIVRMGNFDINLAEEDEAASRACQGHRLLPAGRRLPAVRRGRGDARRRRGAWPRAAAPCRQRLPRRRHRPRPADGPGAAAAVRCRHRPGVRGRRPWVRGAGGGGAAPWLPELHDGQHAGAKFCSSCGTSLAPPTATAPCATREPGRGQVLLVVRHALMPQTSNCANCGEELLPGAKFVACGTPTAPIVDAPPAAADAPPPPPPPAPPAAEG